MLPVFCAAYHRQPSFELRSKLYPSWRGVWNHVNVFSLYTVWDHHFLSEQLRHLELKSTILPSLPSKRYVLLSRQMIEVYHLLFCVSPLLPVIQALRKANRKQLGFITLQYFGTPYSYIFIISKIFENQLCGVKSRKSRVHI